MLRSKNTETFFQEIEAALTASMKQQGFTATLKALNKGRFPAVRVLTSPTSGMMSVLEGVVEELPSGLYNAALQTDKGRVVLRNAQRTDRPTDPQLIASTKSSSLEAAADSAELTSDVLLHELTNAGPNSSTDLLCAVELTRFKRTQQEVLLPILWQYILAHRDSNNRDDLVATGAAIRKYIAIMPMDRIGELAVLLESGHRAPLPIDLEIEVAKMVFRNFEVHPPVAVDTHPELAQRLWEMVQAYVNPRILLRDKHSAAASLAIEAIVAMRSSLAFEACQAAAQCSYRWFAELVSDDLDDLHEKWSCKSPDTAAWLSDLRNQVLPHA